MCFTMDERLVPEPVDCLVVDFVQAARARSGEQVAQTLARGNPSIHCVVEGNALVIVVETVRDGEELTIAARLREATGTAMESGETELSA